MRGLGWLRKSARDLALNALAMPKRGSLDSVRKKNLSDYAAIRNLALIGGAPIQDPSTGLIYWMMDYDAIP